MHAQLSRGEIVYLWCLSLIVFLTLSMQGAEVLVRLHLFRGQTLHNQAALALFNPDDLYRTY